MQNLTAPTRHRLGGNRGRLIVTCLLALLANGPAQAQRADENMDVEGGGVREIVGAPVRALPAGAALAQGGDEVILEMASAFRRKDASALGSLLPQAAGHPLEPWAAYWELNARLATASQGEVDAFLRKFAGTYQEDRLRNDWLLQLGKSRDFAAFDRYYPAFRMRDDAEVRCYALYSSAVLKGRVQEDDLAALREGWMSARDADNACPLAAGGMLAKQRIGEEEIWRKARSAAEGNRMGAARSAVGLIDSSASASVPALFANPSAYLQGQADGASRSGRQMAVLALTRLASANPEAAAQEMQAAWASRLEPRERDWVWGQIGKQTALNLDNNALNRFGQVRDVHNLSDDQLGWMARAAMRLGNWAQLRQAVDAMPRAMQAEPVWTYWRARALQGQFHLRQAPDQEAAGLYRRIAGNQGFYEQLAQEALGEKIRLPQPPAPLQPAEKAAARANAGLQRALHAYTIGLRSEATREWNYTTNLHQPGGMNDRDLLAAADLACENQWWDRCINTSERTRGVVDMQQRFPMPYRSTVVARSQEIGLDPAYVYGLIRQESRFATAARSGAGAKGLMQVMPATARYTARKLGIPYDGSLNDLDTNVRIGTGYLKLALDDFEGSYPLAAAAYNAGPNRPRSWRNGPTMEGAVFAENIPFGETRDYVKKVLANTVNYALTLTGRPQSLLSRLGQVGPLAAGLADPARELPSPEVREIRQAPAAPYQPFPRRD